MKIGVWLNPDYSPEVGGGYSYYSRLIDGIDNYSFSDGIEICYIIEGNNTPRLNRPIIHLSYTPASLTIKERMLCQTPLMRHKVQQAINNKNEWAKINNYMQILHSNCVKLIYYPIPFFCPLPDFPFIATHWDVGHRSTYAFPEITGGKEFQNREYFYNNILPRALFIFCESNTGKEELSFFTNLNPIKIKVVPIFAGNKSIVDKNTQNTILNEFNISKNKFFFYPAQFWAHKNHITLLESFKKLLIVYSDYKLVLTGSDQGNLSYIKEKATQLGIDSSVVFAGFVNNKIVSTLYHNATALVMPTMLGPTNMPLLEALEYKCPVICSDIPGHYEELNDTAKYFNPLDSNDISKAMETIIERRNEYINRIDNYSSKNIFTLENALRAINEHLQAASIIRNCWK